ncbi:hypothetical protein NUSPORA_00657 [Nucleospora cyclopteri]
MLKRNLKPHMLDISVDKLEELNKETDMVYNKLNQINSSLDTFELNVTALGKICEKVAESNKLYRNVIKKLSKEFKNEEKSEK